MAIALVVYLCGPQISAAGTTARRGRARRAGAKLTGRDWATMAVLIALLPVLAMTAIGNQEIFNAYLLWGEQHYNLDFFGQTHADDVADLARRDHLNRHRRRRARVLERLCARTGKSRTRSSSSPSAR